MNVNFTLNVRKNNKEIAIIKIILVYHVRSECTVGDAIIPGIKFLELKLAFAKC